MFPFSQSVTPAVKSHMQAQMSFFNDVSKSLLNSFQQLGALNMQLAQTLLEETNNTSQEIITAERPIEMFSVTASHAQPAAQKLRVYQEHISRLAADTQVELANVAEQHVPQTSRTAKALAEQVARTANEEAEKSMRTQQDLMQKFSDPFQHLAEGGMQSRQTRANIMRGSESMQSAGGQGSQSGSVDQGAKQGGPGRKE